MIRIHIGVVAFISFLHLAIGLAIGLAAPRAGAATLDTPTRICAELRNGVLIAPMFVEMKREGYTEHNAGVTVGSAVMTHCIEQRPSAIRQAQDMLREGH